ncbi:MAG: HAMP domain-containing sensor histidine kinase [Syntrophaceticus schinkii]
MPNGPKNELITSVSHDLRTPLTSILGYLDRSTVTSTKDEVELRYYVNIAYHKSQRLKKMIDDLFEFTRMSYVGMKSKPELIDLGELLGQLAEESVPLFREADMEYRLSVPREKITVLADGDLLARVFDNLVSNGIRYGKTGKYVDLELVKGWPLGCCAGGQLRGFHTPRGTAPPFRAFLSGGKIPFRRDRGHRPGACYR